MNIVFNNEKAIFLQIVEEYKKYIEIGIFKDKERLPSVRTLAIELKINPNTVARAYQILEEDGYIKTQNKKGVYVSYKQNKVEEYTFLEYKILELKKDGIKEDDLIKAIKKIYGGKENVRN